MRVVALALALFLVPAAAAAQRTAIDTLPTVALPPGLDRVLRDYERAWAAGDTAALALLFTEDGFVPGRHGWRRGQAAIRAQYSWAKGDLRLSAHAYAVQDTVGYIIGAYRYGDGDGGGKFILALRRSSGDRWLIAADLDQSNQRPAPDDDDR